MTFDEHIKNRLDVGAQMPSSFKNRLDVGAQMPSSFKNRQDMMLRAKIDKI